MQSPPKETVIDEKGQPVLGDALHQYHNNRFEEVEIVFLVINVCSISAFAAEGVRLCFAPIVELFLFIWERRANSMSEATIFSKTCHFLLSEKPIPKSIILDLCSLPNFSICRFCNQEVPKEHPSTQFNAIIQGLKKIQFKKFDKKKKGDLNHLNPFPAVSSNAFPNALERTPSERRFMSSDRVCFLNVLLKS